MKEKGPFLQPKSAVHCVKANAAASALSSWKKTGDSGDVKNHLRKVVIFV